VLLVLMCGACLGALFGLSLWQYSGWLGYGCWIVVCILVGVVVLFDYMACGMHCVVFLLFVLSGVGWGLCFVWVICFVVLNDVVLGCCLVVCRVFCCLMWLCWCSFGGMWLFLLFVLSGVGWVDPRGFMLGCAGVLCILFLY